MKIKSLECTCPPSPSQWEGTTENNEAIYIRYRWGRLIIQLSEPDGTVNDAIVSGRILYQKQIGDDRLKWALIGNSVPSSFMYAIAKTIKEQILT